MSIFRITTAVQDLSYALQTLGISEFSIHFPDSDAGAKLQSAATREGYPSVTDEVIRGHRYSGSICGVPLSWPDGDAPF